MKLVLVTGMSGAGKSLVLKALEDCGFEAIDNIPLAFLPALARSGQASRNIAVGWDIRSRDFSAADSLHTLSSLRQQSNLQFTMLFLDCDDEVLRRRYSETRRRHPLALDRPVTDGIAHERELLSPLREAADMVLDSSETEANTMRHTIISEFGSADRSLSLVINSFSFKRGLPREADMVFDVRFLKNPHYQPELQPKTGLEPDVGAYIESDEGFATFFDGITRLIVPLLPRYMAEGKSYLTIGIGCTGGKHRSVHVAQKLGGFLQQSGYKVTIRHRDIAAT